MAGPRGAAAAPDARASDRARHLPRDVDGQVRSAPITCCGSEPDGNLPRGLRRSAPRADRRSLDCGYGFGVIIENRTPNLQRLRPADPPICPPGRTRRPPAPARVRRKQQPERPHQATGSRPHHPRRPTDPNDGVEVFALPPPNGTGSEVCQPGTSMIRTIFGPTSADKPPHDASNLFKAGASRVPPADEESTGRSPPSSQYQC